MQGQGGFANSWSVRPQGGARERKARKKGGHKAPRTTIPRRSYADAGGVAILGAGPVDGSVWRACSAWMAGPVKDREAFQRLNFLYQVSPRLTHGGEPNAEGPQ